MTSPSEEMPHRDVAERLAAEGVLARSAQPEAAIAFVLQLNWARSLFVVGQALWARYPTEAAWQEAINSQAFLELVDEVAMMIADVRMASNEELADPAVIAEGVRQHYNRALDGVEAFVGTVPGLTAEDLLTVLLN